MGENEEKCRVGNSQVELNMKEIAGLLNVKIE
jgi:hypothetical protein